MVSISTTGSSVVFTFTNCPYYLNNGTIEVPKNALALVIDSSDMVTFKKAASNDIFISVPLSELDMTKEEVEELYYDMCSTGGGSGSGVTSGEVQTMIDESISGKADTSAVTEEISAAVSGKADSSAVTEEISAAVSGKADSSAVTEEITAAVSGKADTSAVTEEITAAVSGKADTSALTVYFDGAVYEMSGQTHVINFYNGNVIKATIDADDFIKDGMVDSVAIENGYLVITFNTDSGKQPISIPLTDIFDPSNYYTTAQTDSAIASAVSGKADSSAVTEEISAAVSGKADSSAVTEEITAAVSGKADSSAVTQEITAAVSDKANKSSVFANYGLGLTNNVPNLQFKNGNSINIGNPIYYAKINDKDILTTNGTWAGNNLNFSLVATSAITTLITSGSTDSQIPTAKAVYDQLGGGGGTVDPTLDSGSTNAVANSAITAAINDLTEAIEDDELVIVNGFIRVDEALSGKADSSAVTAEISAATSGKADTTTVDTLSGTVTAHTADTTVHVTSQEKSTWNGKQDALTIDSTVVSGSTNPVSGGAVYSQLGGVKIVALSQQAYDALAPDYDPNTLYIING